MRTLRLALAAALLLALAPQVASSAASSLPAPAPQVSWVHPFASCGRGPGWQCATIAVPLDWSGHVPGRISLRIYRLLATGATTDTAVFAIRGGPSAHFVEQMAGNAQPFLAHNDFYVIDARGASSLGCAGATTPAQVGRCGRSLGKSASFYGAAESIRDIEAVRGLVGSPQLTIYGLGYGAQLALNYAQVFPSDVAGLILDSPLLTDSLSDPWHLSTLKAISTLLSSYCFTSANGCQAYISLETILQELQQEALPPKHGQAKASFPYLAQLKASGMMTAFSAVSANPSLLPPLLSALTAANEAHPSALLTLIHKAKALLRKEGLSGPQGWHWATACADTPSTWGGNASTAARRGALAKAEGILQHAASEVPVGHLTSYFPASAIEALSVLPECADWPGTPNAPIKGAMPNVPVVILHGTDDVTTPLTDLRTIAALFPRTQVVTEVASVGQDVLDNEPYPYLGAQAVDLLAQEQAHAAGFPTPVADPNLIAPDIQFTLVPTSSPVRSTTITWNIVGAGNNAYQAKETCTLDGRQFGCGGTSRSFNNLAVGYHLFSVTVTGPGGTNTEYATWIVLPAP